MDLQNIIGDNVRKLRQAASISQEELAARIDVDQAYISRLESGQINVTASTIQQLAIALSIQPKSLLNTE
jgi:transcriptional regulator with XRE-family HTH domain